MANICAEFLRKQKKGYGLTAASLPGHIEIHSFNKSIPGLYSWESLTDLLSSALSFFLF